MAQTRNTIRKKKITWTKIYQDVTDKGLIITCNAPVYLKNGEIRGVVGVDITMRNLINNILNIKFEQPGAYAALITSAGEVITDPDESILGTDTHGFAGELRNIKSSVFEEITQNVQKGESGLTEAVLSNENKYVLYSPIGQTGWALVYFIPVSEITELIEKEARDQLSALRGTLLAKIFPGTLVILLTVTFVSIRFSTNITKPIKNLARGVSALGRGDFDHEVPVDSKDEIGILSTSFNNMAGKLKETVSALEQKAREQQTLNNELAELNRDLEKKVHERTSRFEEANSKLQEALNNIRAVERSRRELLATVSHELRTPLMKIQGYVETIRDGLYQDEKEFSRYLETIYLNTNGISRLISDLFELSQLEARQSMDFKIIDLTRILQQYFEETALFLEQKGFHFIYTMDKALPLVRVDTDRIIQVLDNLVFNAVKFTSAGGFIQISVKALHDEVQIAVSDNGKGITEQDLPHIFTRFYKGRNDIHLAAVNGSGLGLAIAKAIIEVHHGSIWAESSPGKGSRFIFTIPANDS